MKFNVKWTDEKINAAIKLLTEYFEQHGNAESILQNEDAQRNAAVCLYDIAEDILIDAEGIITVEE